MTYVAHACGFSYKAIVSKLAMIIVLTPIIIIYISEILTKICNFCFGFTIRQLGASLLVKLYSWPYALPEVIS
jgi:hypothetical protein